ncbi:unnamed protein product, partial [Symbiodinium necroappetens]
DFYAVNEEGRVPKHDVLLTNPPYSGEHVEYLLRFCRSNAKPFLLLMPNYFCSKDFYDDALGGTSQSVLYLCPRKRYFYWTPKGLRTRSKVQSQHAGEGGNRTSPFISFWYIDLSPLMSAKALMRWWQDPLTRSEFFRVSCLPSFSLLSAFLLSSSQRTQYPLMQEYTLNHNTKAPII